ncbi:hypothetical protein CBL_11028 [Carabus blaptoides fortunei]
MNEDAARAKTICPHFVPLIQFEVATGKRTTVATSKPSTTKQIFILRLRYHYLGGAGSESGNENGSWGTCKLCVSSHDVHGGSGLSYRAELAAPKLTVFPLKQARTRCIYFPLGGNMPNG